MDSEVKISIGVDVAAAVTKLGGFAKDLEAATDKSTALQKSLAAVGVSDMKGLSPQIVAQIENTNRSMIDLAQTAGLTKNQIEALNKQFGGEIGNAAAASAIANAREKIVQIGEAAGLSEQKLREMAASVGMSADQIAARFDKVVPAIISDFERMAAAAGLPAEAIKRLNNSFGVDIGKGLDAARLNKTNESILQIGESAGLTEARMREMAAELGMSADQIAARFEKIPPAIISDFEKIAAAAGIPISAIQRLNSEFGGKIANAQAASAIEHARTQLMSMGVAAGLSASDLQKMGASIGMSAKETEAHTVKVSSSFAKMAEASGMSAAQLTNVTRMLPMQFTDIVTSLASGMPAYMVAIQQGGQIKDMYGSMGLAARALSEYILGLINPFTIAAAAVGVLALAYNQGSREADAYRLALVNTGNAAGLTTGQLAGMAQHIGDTVGTVGGAAAALAALSATGEVTGANMEKFAQSAIYAQKGLKQDIEDTAKVFAQLGESPVQASAKLNEKLHYLTAATFAQIKAAQDLGDKETAASIAQNAYAEAIEARGKKMIAAMGSLERGWMGIAGAAKWAWDSMLDIGREEDPTAKAAAAAVKLLDLRAKLQSGNYGGTGNEQYDRAVIESQIADQERIVGGIQKKTAAENAAAKAQAENAKKDEKNIWLQQQKDSYLEDFERIGRDSKKLRKEWADAGATPEEINKALGIMNRPLAAQALQRTDEFYSEYAAIIKDGEKLAQNELSGQHAAGLIADIDFYTKKQTLAENSVTDQMAVIELEIEATRKSGIGYAEKASKLAAFNAQYSALEREQVAIAQQAGIDIAAAKRKEAQRSAAESIRESSDALEAGYKLALVKDADYYQNAAQNTAKYQQEKANLALETYLNESRYALQGSQVEIDARQKMIKVVRDIGLERELANKNALASAFEYGRAVDLSLQRQAYESSLVLQTSEERTKLLAIYDIEAQKLEKIRQIMATTPKGKARDKSIADIEAAAAKAKQGEVSKALNAEWKTHLDFAEGVARGIWDDYTSGAGNAAQNALAKLKKELFDEIYKLALKPLVLDVVANITGQAGAVSAFAGASGASSSGLANMATSAMGLPSLGAIGGSLSTGIQAGWAGTSLTGAVSAYTAAGETTVATMLGLGEQIGSLAAAMGPVGLGVAGIAALAGSGMFGDNNSKVGGTYEYTAGQGIDVWRDEAGRTRLGTDGIEIGDSLIQKGIQSAADNINKILEQIGSTSRVKSLTAGAQSSSEKAEAMVEAYGTLDTGKKFGIQGEQKLNKTASPEEVIKDYQTALNQATLEAIKQAADIPKSVKDMLEKVDPRGIENDKFNEYLARIVSDAQAVLTETWTGFDVSSFGDLLVGMADTSVGAAQYMSDGISESIGAAWAGRIQSQFNEAMFTGVLQPIISTATVSELSAAVIQEQLGAAKAVIENMRSQMGAMKEVLQSDDFKGLMKDIGDAMGEAQEPIKELQTYMPQTSKSVQSFADTASSASKDIADAAKKEADAAKKEADERKGLQDKLDNLTMTRAELLAKERDAVEESNRALFDQLKAREAFDAANKLAQSELAKQAGLQADLLDAQGNAATATEMRRVAAIKTAVEGMNEYNAELVAGAMIATNALEDQVSAAKELQSISSSLNDKFSSLQVDLLTAQGDEVGAKRLKRQQELDGLLLNKSDSDAAEIKNLYYRNAAIEDQIELSNKSKKSSEDAAKAWEDSQQKMRDAAKEAAGFWRDIGKTLEDEIKRLRGELLGDTMQGLAQVQADFAIAQAQAAAGDKDAAERLPELSSRMVEIAKNMGMAGADLRQIQGETAMSLEYVQSAAKARADALLKQADAPIAPMPIATVAPVLTATNKAASNDLSLALTGLENKVGDMIEQSIANNNQLTTVVRQSAALPVTVAGVVRTV